MTSIIRMVRAGNTQVIIEHFRTVLRVLLENLDDTEGASRALVFGVITEMLKQDNLISGFHAFTQLVSVFSDYSEIYTLCVPCSGCESGRGLRRHHGGSVAS